MQPDYAYNAHCTDHCVKPTAAGLHKICCGCVTIVHLSLPCLLLVYKV